MKVQVLSLLAVPAIASTYTHRLDTREVSPNPSAASFLTSLLRRGIPIPKAPSGGTTGGITHDLPGDVSPSPGAPSGTSGGLTDGSGDMVGGLGDDSGGTSGGLGDDSGGTSGGLGDGPNDPPSPNRPHTNGGSGSGSGSGSGTESSASEKLEHIVDLVTELISNIDDLVSSPSSSSSSSSISRPTQTATTTATTTRAASPHRYENCVIPPVLFYQRYLEFFADCTTPAFTCSSPQLQMNATPNNTWATCHRTSSSSSSSSSGGAGESSYGITGSDLAKCKTVARNACAAMRAYAVGRCGLDSKELRACTFSGKDAGNGDGEGDEWTGSGGNDVEGGGSSGSTTTTVEGAAGTVMANTYKVWAAWGAASLLALGFSANL